ncbi:MAG: PQQ-dependent sugar dehydrogenase [Pseudomonadota bacterium]
MQRVTAITFVLLIQLFTGPLLAEEKSDFRVTTIAEGLEHPWAMAFLPNNRILISERPGNLRLIENGKLRPQTITGLPPVSAQGQGGLLDIALHPEYKKNGWIYLSFSAAGKGGLGTEVIRGRLKGMRLIDVERIFRVERKSRGGRHFGSRLLFDQEGYLYITLGERGERPRAQELNDHAGSVVRLHDDGRIPQDNPFVGIKGAKSEIYSYGHRNPQGMTLHPRTGEVWTHEHGPQGGDEINIIQAGNNYGWPVITYGVNYGWGTKIGEGTHKAGMEQPLYYWDPSIAPSGMALYSGDKIPQWRGNLFVGALKFQLLVRLELDGNRIVKEHRLLKGELGRIRDVRNGPDGYLYLLTDEDNGKLVRIEPAM